MRTVIFLFGILLLTNCHPRLNAVLWLGDHQQPRRWPAIPVCLTDKDANDQDVITTTIAAAELNERLGFVLITRECAPTPHHIQLRGGGHLLPVERLGECEHLLYTRQRQHIYSAFITINPAAHRRGVGDIVTAHELGHALGLAHSTNRACNMYPVVYSHQKWCEESLEQLRAAYAR